MADGGGNTPMNNAEWLAWLEEHDEQFREQLKTATRVRRDLGKGWKLQRVYQLHRESMLSMRMSICHFGAKCLYNKTLVCFVWMLLLVADPNKMCSLPVHSMVVRG